MLKKETQPWKRCMEYDSLCNVFNGKASEERIQALIQKNKEGVLLVVNIDNFSVINNRFGYLIGDKVLVRIARELCMMFSDRGFIGRVKGDEFIIFIEKNKEKEFIVSFINNMKRLIHNIEMDIIGDVKLYITVGASFVALEDTYKTLFNRAQQERVNTKIESDKQKFSGNPMK